MPDIHRIDSLWVLLCTILVMLQQLGFLQLEAGLTRNKNSINIGAKNLADACVAFSLFWAVGYALAYNPSGLAFDIELLFFTGENAAMVNLFLFQALFCCTAVTIVAGAVAERMGYRAYLVLAAFIALFTYPIAVNWVWSDQGWLKSWGYYDFAGGATVHALAGSVALVAAAVIGPRQGRFDSKGKPQALARSNLNTAIQGGLLLWIGWIGFNGGSSGNFDSGALHAVLTTMIGACVGFLAILSYQLLSNDVVDLPQCMNGLLAGLVSITAGANLLSPTETVFFAMVGAFIMLMTEKALLRMRIDDAIGVVPVHLAAGAWGAIMLGVSVEADFKLSTQLAGTACILCLGAGTTYLFMQLVGLFMPWRVSEEAEALGLNISEHGAKDSLGELVSAIQNNLSSDTPDKRLPEDPSNELNVISAKVNELLSSISAGHDALKKEKDSVSATLANVERLNNAIATHTAVSTTDLRGKITFVNKKFCELSGYSEHKLLHSSHRLLNSNHHDTAFWQQFWGVLNKGESWNGKICNRKRDGEHYWVEATVTPNFHGKQLIGYISMQTEIKA